MRAVRMLGALALVLTGSVAGVLPAASMMVWLEFEFLFERYDDERAIVASVLERELVELAGVDLAEVRIGIHRYGTYYVETEADIRMVTAMIVHPTTCMARDCLIVHLEQKPDAANLSVSFTLFGTGTGGYTFSDVLAAPDYSPSYYWRFQQTGGEVRVAREGPRGTPVTMVQE